MCCLISLLCCDPQVVLLDLLAVILSEHIDDMSTLSYNNSHPVNSCCTDRRGITTVIMVNYIDIGGPARGYTYIAGDRQCGCHFWMPNMPLLARLNEYISAHCCWSKEFAGSSFDRLSSLLTQLVIYDYIFFMRSLRQ